MSLCGENIKRLRQQKGISQNKLAKESGIAQSALSAIESSVKNPSVETVQLIAGALGVPISELLGESAGEDQLTAQERHLLEMFRHLNPVGKSTALGLVESLLVQFGEKNNPSRSVSNE